MKRKYDPLLHAFFDHTGIARHLEKRARQGWMLDYIRTNTFFRYRRCEPKDLRFAVTYFPTASEFSAPEDDQKEFYDLCAAAGYAGAGACRKACLTTQCQDHGYGHDPYCYSDQFLFHVSVSFV